MLNQLNVHRTLGNLDSNLCMPMARNHPKIKTMKGIRLTQFKTKNDEQCIRSGSTLTTIVGLAKKTCRHVTSLSINEAYLLNSLCTHF